MKKMFLITTAMLIAFCWSARIFAAGTTGNWKAVLSFSTNTGKTDSKEIEIGEGPSVSLDLKPPHLPSVTTTGKTEDAVINAYVVVPGARSDARSALRDIQSPVVDAPGKVWAIEVYTEEAGAKVFLDVNLADFNSKDYTFTVIVPDTGEIKTFTTSLRKQEIYTAEAAGTKTIYVMASKSLTMVSSSATKTTGAVRSAGRYMAKGIKVYDNGTQVATTNDSGIFTIQTPLSVGHHTIRVDAPYFLGSQVEVDVTADGVSPILMEDIYPGDINNDGKITINDLARIKQLGCYNNTIATCLANHAGAADEIIAAINASDINGDGKVNINDLAAMKVGYLKKEAWLKSGQ